MVLKPEEEKRDVIDVLLFGYEKSTATLELANVHMEHPVSVQAYCELTQPRIEYVGYSLKSNETYLLSDRKRELFTRECSFA